MRKLTRGSLATMLAYGLAFAVILPALGMAATIATADVAKAKVVVLPLANNTKVGGTELAQRVQDALQLSLVATDRATIMSLRPSAPAVRRAIEIDKTLEPSDLEIKPPVSRSQAEKIGRALGADMVLWGSIEEYNSDQRAKQVTIGLSIQKLDLRSDQVNAIAVTGKSAAKVGFEGGEGALISEAIDNAVSQVVEQALGVPAVSGAKPQPAQAPTVTRKKNKTWQIVGAALAAAAVIALASNQGGGGAPAVLPGVVTSAIATPTADSVDLSWDTAATNVTSFNVFRADMGQVSRMSRVPRSAHSRVRLTRQAAGYSLLANVGRADRAYRDVSAVIGSLYAYKIAAVIGASETTWVDFINFYQQDQGEIKVGPDYPRPPAMPVCANGLQSVHVAWARNPEPFIDSYRVLRATSATGPWSFLGAVAPGAAQPSFDDTGVTTGATYYYAIAAVTTATGPNGLMGPARQITFQPGKPVSPSGVIAEPRIGGVELSWTASPDTSVTGYRIFRNGTQIAQVAATTTSYLDSPLAAGSYTYEVAAVAGTVESDRVTATPAPVSPSNAPTSLTIADPGPVVANGTSTVDIVATARDSAQAPVQGVAVVFSLSGGGGTLVAHPSYPATQVPAGLRVLTNATGKAAVRFKAGTDPQLTPVVTAACSGAGGTTLTATLTIVLQARTIAGLTLEAESPIVPGDGTSGTVLTATVVDQGGAGLSGVTVQFESLATNLGIVSPASAVTDADGKAMTTLSSAASGRYGSCTVQASAAGVDPAQVVVQFVAPPNVNLVVDPWVIPAAGAGSTALLTATAKYLTGDPVADGTIIRFSFSDGAAQSETGAQIAEDQRRVLTKGGIAYSTIVSPTTLPDQDYDVVRAWVDSDDDGVWDSEPSGTAMIFYTAPPAFVIVRAEPTSVPANGRSVSKVTAEVYTAEPDETGSFYEKVADNTPVTFTTTLGTFVESGTTEVTARTAGGATSAYVVAPKAPGVANVTATSALVSGSVQVEFTQALGSILSIAADPSTIQANGTDTSTITIRLTDGDGSPQASKTVDVFTDLGRLSESALVTDDSGEASTTLTAGLTSGSASVIARFGATTSLVTVVFTAGAPHDVSLSIIAPNATLACTNGLPSPSGAEPTAQVTARVTDEHGNAVRDGTPVFFHTDIGQITASAPTADGVATGTLTTCNFLDASTKADFPGRAVVTARCQDPAGPIIVTPEPYYAVFSGDADFWTWSGSPSGTYVLVPPAAAGQPLTIYCEFYDRNGNPLPSGLTVNAELRVGTATVTASSLTNTPIDPVYGAWYCWTEITFAVPADAAADGVVRVYAPAVINYNLIIEEFVTVEPAPE